MAWLRVGMGLLVLVLIVLVGIHVHFLGGEFRDWVEPENSLTLLGVIAGFLLLAWQLDRQHRNSLAQLDRQHRNAYEQLASQHQDSISVNAESARNALNLEIYRELADASEAASAALSHLDGVVLNVILDVPLRRDHFVRFGTILPPQGPYQRVNEARSDKVLSLMRVMEKWEVALGADFDKFKQGIGENLGLLGQKGETFTRLAGPYLFEAPVPWPPTDADIQAVNAEGQELQAKSFDIIMNVWGLRSASQNRLLGGLFTYRVPTRKPGDPRVTVGLPENDEANTGQGD